MQVGKTLLAKQRTSILGHSLVKCQANQYSDQATKKPQLSMADEETKHRVKLPLYDLRPKIDCCWIAPNSTIVGEVDIRRWASVWYNSVVRGDINRVT